MSSEHNVSHLFRDYLAALDVVILRILGDEENPGIEPDAGLALAAQLAIPASMRELNHFFLERVTDPTACWQKQLLLDTVPCDGWLEGQSDIAPEHMCWRKYVHSVNLLFDFHPSWPWPVGIGRKSFSVWRDYIAEGASIPKSDISAILRVNRGFQGEKPDSVFVPDLPGFLVARDDAWLGLVAARDLSAGQVYLLGLVVNCAEDESEFWRPGSWKWTDALLVIQPLADKGLASLTDTGKTLLTWYNKVLLGNPVLGRSVGSTAIPDAEFPALYEAAYRRLWREMERRPGNGDIYHELGIGRTAFYGQVARLRAQGVELPCPSEPAPPDPEL